MNGQIYRGQGTVPFEVVMSCLSGHSIIAALSLYVGYVCDYQMLQGSYGGIHALTMNLSCFIRIIINSCHYQDNV